jgi:hypothetical protein
MNILTTLIFIWFGISVLAQNQFPDIDWTSTGLSNGEKKGLEILDFQSLNTVSDKSPNDVLDSLMMTHPEGAVILFKAGDYHFTRQIKLPSYFVLRGEGAAHTNLIFDLENEESAIYVGGKPSRELIALSHPVVKGESEIHFQTTDLTKYPLVDVGEFVMLADNDEHLITSSWAKGRTGQMIEVKRVGLEGIEMVGKARRTYNMVNKPVLQKVKMVEQSGIEKLRIVNNTKTERQTSNIHFSFAHNCWVSMVTSQKANYSHVLLEYSSHCEVKNSTFRDAHEYGNGGKGYGITLQFATSECLVSANRLIRLRHSILLQAGANGNAIHANKSESPYWDGVFLPKNSAGDIVLHGNYVYANLIQKNSCENLVIDNSHGPNGPDNLIFDNLIRGYGLIMNRKSVMENIYLINNILTNDKMLKGKYRTTKEAIEVYNTVKGKEKPKGSEKVDKESFLSK